MASNYNYPHTMSSLAASPPPTQTKRSKLTGPETANGSTAGASISSHFLCDLTPSVNSKEEGASSDSGAALDDSEFSHKVDSSAISSKPAAGDEGNNSDTDSYTDEYDDEDYGDDWLNDDVMEAMGQTPDSSHSGNSSASSNHPNSLKQTFNQQRMGAMLANTQLGFISSKRIMHDLKAHMTGGDEGFWMEAYQECLDKICVIIEGPSDTPYSNGLFCFLFSFTDNYPIKPPIVKIVGNHYVMASGSSGSVRFNPNLYKCGKVCLSILGTWSGPAWSSAMTISSVCLSLQSILNENPIQNEPGWSSIKKDTPAAQCYVNLCKYNTLRSAVLHLIKTHIHQTPLPESLKAIVISYFKGNFRVILAKAKGLLHLEGKPIYDPYDDGVQKIRTDLYGDFIQHSTPPASTSTSASSPISLPNVPPLSFTTSHLHQLPALPPALVGNQHPRLRAPNPAATHKAVLPKAFKNLAKKVKVLGRTRENYEIQALIAALKRLATEYDITYED